VSSLQVARELDELPKLLHLHGGGYVVGSAFGYRPLAGALALAADAGVLVPDYRLAPEHTFPAAIEDSVAAYSWMLDRGVEPEQVTITGDSAGGGLVVSTLLMLKQRGLPQPGGAVLMCPWVDLELKLRSDQTVRRSADAYLAGHRADDPLASPLGADLSGLAPLLIQAATGDELLVDAQGLTDRARAQGVEVELDLYPVDAHVFHIFWSFLPEAAEALKAAGEFAKRPSEPARAAGPARP